MCEHISIEGISFSIEKSSGYGRCSFPSDLAESLVEGCGFVEKILSSTLYLDFPQNEQISTSNAVKYVPCLSVGIGLWEKSDIAIEEVRDEAFAILEHAASTLGLSAVEQRGETMTADSTRLFYIQGKGDYPYYIVLLLEQDEAGNISDADMGIYVSKYFSSQATTMLESTDEDSIFGITKVLFDYEKANSSSAAEKPSTPKDEKITETNGKTVYKVYATSSSIHFTGSFTGSGHFSIELLNGNQNLIDLVANEIGDHKVDKTVSVSPGSMYYIQIETTDGQWNISWTGTGGD